MVYENLHVAAVPVCHKVVLQFTNVKHEPVHMKKNKNYCVDLINLYCLLQLTSQQIHLLSAQQISCNTPTLYLH